jgi:hypothetical protein
VPREPLRPSTGVEDADDLASGSGAARELGHLPVAHDAAPRDRTEHGLDPRGEVDRPGSAAVDGSRLSGAPSGNARTRSGSPRASASGAMDRSRFPRASPGTARALGDLQRLPASLSIATRHSSRRAANHRSDAV